MAWSKLAIAAVAVATTALNASVNAAPVRREASGTTAAVFGYGNADGAANCDTASMVDSEEECRLAGEEVGYPFAKSVNQDATAFGVGRPAGCFWDQNGRSYYNTNLESSSTWGGVGGICRTVKMYEQCGGLEYTGVTTCAAGSACTEKNEYYSQCLPEETDGTCIAMYGQCGGQGFEAAEGAECCNGFECAAQNEWYSQCVPSAGSRARRSAGLDEWMAAPAGYHLDDTPFEDAAGEAVKLKDASLYFKGSADSVAACAEQCNGYAGCTQFVFCTPVSLSAVVVHDGL